MKDDIRLAAVGDNCIDLYDQTGDAYPGGNPVNVAVYTVRLGGCASYTGVVGDDKYGGLMRQAVAAKGVDVSHLHTEPGSTALSHVTVVNGDRVFGDYEEGVMENFRLTEEDVDFLCGHDLVVSGLWGRVEGDLPRLKTRGVPVAFDCANRPEDPAAEKALPWVDYAFFSNDSAGDRELEDILRAIHTKGPELVVATRGERGSLAFDGSRFYRGDIVPCTVVDTMGAGDSFIAGFFYGLSIDQRHSYLTWCCPTEEFRLPASVLSPLTLQQSFYHLLILCSAASRWVSPSANITLISGSSA